MSNPPKKNKWKQILEIISLYGMAIVLITISISLELSGNGFHPVQWILDILVVAVLIAGGTKALLDYKKDKLPSGERNILDNQQHYNKIEKRKKRQREIKRNHNSMLKEFSQNSLEYHFQMTIILFIVGCLFIALLWMQYNDFIPTYIYFIAIGMLAIVLIIYWIYKATGLATKHFAQMIRTSGFYLKDVESDYLHGTICVAMSGYLCIGQQYSIYCSFNKESFIISNQNIVGVEKRVFTEKVDGIDGKFDRFYLRIYTNDYWRAFMTDDIGADVVLQEYERRGIKTRLVDER